MNIWKNRELRKEEHKLIADISFMFSRYIALLAVGTVFLFSDFFNKLLLPLTIHPTNALLNLFYNSFVLENKILVESIEIEIIPACVAVSAYFLLIIFNFATPMKAGKRFCSFLFSIFAMLLLNILRIFILSILLINDAALFEMVHQIFWYILSIAFVVGIWFLGASLFKIKEIPVYSDIIFLLSERKEKRNFVKKNKI